MMRPWRKPKELDWQSLFAEEHPRALSVPVPPASPIGKPDRRARSASPIGKPDRQARSADTHARVLRLWRMSKPSLIGGAMFALGTFASSKLLTGAPVSIAGYLGGAIGGIVAGLTINLIRRESAARANERTLQQAERGLPVIHVLTFRGIEAAGFLNQPPSLEQYEQWLRIVGHDLAGYSPALAREWAVPDAAIGDLRGAVNADAIRQRMARIEMMGQRVGTEGVPLEQLVAAGVPGAESVLALRAWAAAGRS
jgi:hypothetical protein